MTNTRITDPEIMERRYPVILREFGFRNGSGGEGMYRGGDGCVRSMQFLQPLQVSILSERRARAPYGLLGGKDGAMGRNIWIKRVKTEADGKGNGAGTATRKINIGGKGTMAFGTGDILEINTPGGGGWGAPLKEGDEGFPVVVETAPFGFETRGRIIERENVDF
jgi:5-oxoprolinase (ATP-hydrolysing)